MPGLTLYVSLLILILLLLELKTVNLTLQMSVKLDRKVESQRLKLRNLCLKEILCSVVCLLVMTNLLEQDLIKSHIYTN